MLAHNVLISLRVLDLPDEAQSWRLLTIIRHLLTVPVRVGTHLSNAALTHSYLHFRYLIRALLSSLSI
ncbi:MAG: hypothetical protein ACLQU3_14170 [Limisphaerales bacterium]